ncbi:Ig-like domain (group 3), partial [Rhodococcus tukisamuensis]
NGTTDLGGPVDLDAQGNASIAVPLAAGNHAITAVFTGFNEHQGSTSAAHNVAVTPANVATTTSVTGPATAVEGADVVLNVQVSPAPSGGTVQFKNGANNIGGPVTLDSEGKGSITQQFATAGAQSITAVYSGAAGFITSTSDAHTVTVSAPAETDVATTTVLTVPATATKGAAVNLVATVSPDPAGGTVQFMDGTTPIGAPVALMNGKATRSHPFATTGAHEITAIYSGAPGYLTSTAEVATVTVDEPVDGGTSSAGGSLGSLFGSS